MYVCVCLSVCVCVFVSSLCVCVSLRVLALGEWHEKSATRPQGQRALCIVALIHLRRCR